MIDGTEFVRIDDVRNLIGSRTTPATERMALIGARVTDMARAAGWSESEDEGAFEYFSRITYEMGQQDKEFARPPMPDEVTARGLFEEWAAPRGYGMTRTTDSYKSQGTKSAWRGWWACARILGK